MKIVKAELKHLPRLKELYWALTCFEAKNNPDIRITERARIKHYQDMEKTFLEGNSILFVVENAKGAAVGYVEAYDYDRGYSLICDVYIEEKYRGQGLGTKLFFSLFQELKKRGYSRARLQVNKKNRRACEFYKKLRFKEIESDSFLLEKNI